MGMATTMMTTATDITRERIAATEAVIRPYVRRTPLIQADLGRFRPDGGARSPSSSRCCSIPARSRRAARLPTCCCASRPRPAWSRPPAAIMARRSPMPRSGSACPRRSSCPTSPRPPRSSASGAMARSSMVGGSALCRCAGGERSPCRADRRDGGACL